MKFLQSLIKIFRLSFTSYLTKIDMLFSSHDKRLFLGFLSIFLFLSIYFRVFMLINKILIKSC